MSEDRDARFREPKTLYEEDASHLHPARRVSFCDSPHTWNSKTVLESGFHTVVLGFLDCLSVQLGFRIPDT